MSVAGSLGAFLTTLGRGKEDRRKEELAERLEKEREERADLRDQRKNDRAEALAAREVKETSVEQGEDGGFYKVQRNKFGNVINREAADKLTVENIQRESKKGDLSLEQILTNISAGKANIAASEASTEQTRTETRFLPEKYALERRYTEAQIGQANRANTPESRAKVESDPVREEEKARLLQARQRIAKGLETVESAAAKLRRNGFPKLAAELLGAEDEDTK